jgi:hypothetical protein
MSGEGSSGTHAARRRGTTVAHIDLGPTLRRPTGEGGVLLPALPAREIEDVPMRPSDPGKRDAISAWLRSILTGLVSGGVAVGILWGTLTSEVKHLRSDFDSHVVETREDRVEARAERAATTTRVTQLEVRDARRDEATNALKKAVEDLTQEVRRLANRR